MSYNVYSCFSQRLCPTLRWGLVATLHPALWSQSNVVANRVMTTSELNFPDAKDTDSAAPLFEMAQSINDFSLRFTGEQLVASESIGSRA